MGEYMTVRIFVCTSTRTPARVGSGAAMWLIEFLKAGEIPVTRKGFVHGENTTQTELALKALINAFTKLRRPCSALVYCDCPSVVRAFENGWFIYWQRENWTKLNGCPVKHPELWEMLSEKLGPHLYTVLGGRHDYSDVMEGDLRREVAGWRERLKSAF